ncbi:MAG: PQQ-dependent sugar dehydrogenase [Ilumatobacteraceae bacterium]
MLAGVAVGLLGLTATACRLPSRYDVATVVGGLRNPWDASFAPDGSLFFTERVGDVNVWRNGQRITLNRPLDVVAQGEGGMMGIAVDPAFDTNRRIYTCYLSNATGGLDVRVVRWDVSPDWTTLSGRSDLVTGIPATTGRHAGCRTRFGPDGMLWVTTGDAATPGNPQDPRSLGGKVLRITTDGAAAPGNPGGSLLPQIFAYGFRNPQGISFRPSDGRPFLVEHGPSCEDEITPLVAGGNGGWDPVSSGRPGFYNEDVPMTDLAKFPGALVPVWSSGCPTIAPSGGTFVDDPDWGDRNGQMAMAVLKGEQLRMINLSDGVHDPGGALISDRGRLRVAVDGPDGKLYVLTDANPGTIFTVDPVP